MNRLVTSLCITTLLILGASRPLESQTVPSFPTTYGAFTLLADLAPASTDISVMNRIKRSVLANGQLGTLVYQALDQSGTPRGYSISSGSTYPVALNNQLWFNFPPSAAAKGLVFFTGTPNYPYGQIWVTDGTTLGTRLLLSLGTSSGYLSSGGAAEINGIGYMSTGIQKSKGSEAILYKTDGTTNGTIQLKKWSSSTISGGISNLRAVGNRCMFLAWSSSTMGVYATNGSSKGTVLVKSVDLTGVGHAVSCNGYYIFPGNDSYGKELWRSNGTSTGTLRVTDINPSAASSSPEFMTVLGDKVYFAANGGSGNMLYSYTPATNACNAIAMNGSSDPRWLTEMNGKLYYSAVTASEGRELWVYDPTLPQTQSNPQIVRDIFTGASSGDPHYAEYTGPNMYDFEHTSFEVLGDYMYFAAKSEGVNYTLWRSDGTPTGTTQVPGFVSTGASFPNSFSACGGKLFFLARVPGSGNCLFVYDPAYVAPPKAMAGNSGKQTCTLEQNYPNPFNPTTTIQFTLANESEVTLLITDPLGREVKRLCNGERRGAGSHTVEFDAGQLPSGIYMYRLETEGVLYQKKMVLIR